jgi:hypothetical protein
LEQAPSCGNTLRCFAHPHVISQDAAMLTRALSGTCNKFAI